MPSTGTAVKLVNRIVEAQTRGMTSFNAVGVNESSNIRRQTAVIYDVLSEGPIEGLVNGVSSIRLNDNPVANTVNNRIMNPLHSIDCSYNASTGVITDNTGLIFQAKLTTDGVRSVRIHGGKKRTTGTINVTAGNNTIVSTNTSFFHTSDAVNVSIQQTPMLRIDGAGADGAQLVTPIIGYINTAAVRVQSMPLTSVTGTNAYLDLVDTVDSFSGDTATITAAGVTVANTAVDLSAPSRNTQQTPTYNYQNFGFAFRTGEREQPYLPTPVGIGSASIAHNVSGGNIDTDSSSGYPSPSAFNFKTPESYTGNPLTITSDQMNVGNPEEVDEIKISLNFPSGMISQKENGKLGPGFAEYRIQFGYSRDGGSTFTDVVKVGRATISTSISNYNKNGATKSPSSGFVIGETRQPFNRVFTIDVSRYQPFDKYRLIIQRISAVNQKENKWQQTNGGVVKSIENVITDRLTYPYSAYAGVIVDAEDFSQIPKRGYEIRGLKIKVPTNYFPLDSINEYTGSRRTVAEYTRNVTSGAVESSVQDWDGNFRGDKKAFPVPSHINHEPVDCNNPVWVFFDLLTNKRYGLGKYLDEDFDFAQIDKYTMFQLAKYCDELVPDGKGGTEPRFTCNLYIQKDNDALKVLKNLATLIRSMVVWYNGEVTLGTNMQKGSIYTFTKGNVIDGTFSYSGSANRFRHNQIAVSWNDPDDGFKQAIEVVEDHNEIARTGKIKRKNITGFGCTSRGQAQRLGRYHLVTEKTEQEVVNFATGINAAILKPGDVIDIQDPDITDVVASGRVTTSASSTTTIIRTDRDLTSYLNETDTFNLNLIYPSGGAYLTQPLATINSTNYLQGDLILLDEDGNAIDSQAKASNLKDDSGNIVQNFWSEDVRVETKSISSFNASSVTVSSAFSSAPDGEVIYTISGVAAATGADVTGSLRQFIINSIGPDEKQIYNITASEYNVNKYDEVDRGWVYPQYTDIQKNRPLRTEDVPSVTGLTATVVPGGGSDDSSDEEGISSYDVVLNWTLPKSTRTVDEGDALDDVYEHLAGFNIQHNLRLDNQIFNEKEFTTIAHNDVTSGSFRLKNVVPGTEYIARVQVVNTNGQTSGWEQVKFDFPDTIQIPFGAGVLGTGLSGGIQKGGSLTATVDINTSTGAVTLSNNTYVFTPPNGVGSKIISSGGTNTTTQGDFNNVSNGNSGFLLMDYSDSSDCLQAVHVVTDTTATEPDTGAKFNFTFLARLGESNNDLTAASGTISSTKGLPDVTGSSTAFTTDFAVGDVVAFQSAGANRFMARVTHIESNTSMTVDAGIPHTYSGVSVHKQGFKVDRLRDSIIGEIKNTSGTYSYLPFTNKLKIDDANEIADNTVNSAIIVADSITSTHIAADAIDNTMIQAGTITNAEIAAGTIGAAQIAANAITSSQLSANAIAEVSVSANSITSVEIASNAIGAVQIAANAVNGTIIAGNAIGSSEIAINSVNGLIIADGAIDSAGKLASAIVSGAKLADNAINDSRIVAANTIDTSMIATNSINALLIAANAITSSEVKANSINAAAIVAGTITNAEIAGNTINSAVIQAGAVGEPQIGANAITSAKIAANAVETAEIKSNSIVAASIVSGSIDTAEIAANAISNAKISSTDSMTLTVTGGTTGGWTLSATKLSSSKIDIDNGNERILIKDA